MEITLVKVVYFVNSGPLGKYLPPHCKKVSTFNYIYISYKKKIKKKEMIPFLLTLTYLSLQSSHSEQQGQRSLWLLQPAVGVQRMLCVFVQYVVGTY